MTKNKTERGLRVWSVAVVMTMLVVGCASVPTREDIIALEEIRAEIRLLERQEQELLDRKAMLTMSIADREKKLKEIEQKKTELLKYL